MSSATDEGDAALLITLADVARLAQVKRPVVSMWRTRSTGTDNPFPEPVRTADGVEQFDAGSVTTWLEQTGRGNNPDVGDDAAAYAHPASLAGDFPALTALLCLKVVSGELLAGMDLSALEILAREADAEDALLYREIAGLGVKAGVLAGYADRLADASYDPAAAFEQLMADRFRRNLAGHSRTALRENARRLVARMAQGLAVAAKQPVPVFVDPTAGGSDLLIEIARASAGGPVPTFMTSDSDSESCRLARRRLRVHDVHREPLLVDDDGSFQISSAAVLVAQFPSPGMPSMTDTEILSAIDNIVLQMDNKQLAVILGPASALSDRVTSGEATRIRGDLLRSDRVRAILRLPKGLLVSAPRQPLAIWALGPVHPDVRISDRWTIVGDLGDAELGEPEADAIVTDVVAALGSYRSVRAHAFRFARRVPTSRLLARRGSLVGDTARSRGPGHTTSADVALRVEELARGLGFSGDTSTVNLKLEPTEIQDASPVELRALGQLIASGVLRLVPGNRIDDSDLHAPSGRLVIGSAELTGDLRSGERLVDQLIAGRYSAVRYTEPDDIVFCTSPRVAATLDQVGGSVVVFPARVLRSTGKAAGNVVVPEVLATDINAVDPHATEWRLWQIRVAPPDQATSLRESLSAIQHERRATVHRRAGLDELSQLIMDGVTAGLFTVHTQPSISTEETPTGPTTPQEGR